eukprot:NODE_3118_length_2089_cov_10.037207.p2 GENE.NODE_3118_length_2089_cov_10.037207~~NODE_3118_length_2089_cov_10.037207.p2  ORF type:complete len:67 (+),score=4.48 NODE_3118_length_2089_cov_10.037207:982-1182(+)
MALSAWGLPAFNMAISEKCVHCSHSGHRLSVQKRIFTEYPLQHYRLHKSMAGFKQPESRAVCQAAS